MAGLVFKMQLKKIVVFGGGPSSDFIVKTNRRQTRYPLLVKQTILLNHKQAIQQSLDLFQVKAHDIRAFAASKAFYSGVSVDQIMQACHWKAHNTFTFFFT